MSTDVDIINDVDVDKLVLKLQAVDCKSAWDRVLEVGRIVFEGLAVGDGREWQSHRAQKSVSLRKLVRHPACPFRKSALSSAVNIHIFTRANPAVRHMPGIKPTHVVQVLGLPLDSALRMLNTTVELGWGVRELSQNVHSMRRKAGEKRGRPTASHESKAETTVYRALDVIRMTEAELIACKSITTDGKQNMLRTLSEIDAIVSKMQNLLLISEKSRYLLACPTPPRWDSSDTAAVG